MSLSSGHVYEYRKKDNDNVQINNAIYFRYSMLLYDHDNVKKSQKELIIE